MKFLAILWIAAGVGISGCGVESAMMFHINCEGDYQCPDGFYCVTVSQLCTKCSDCSVYKRTKAWRACARDPRDCGKCLDGYEEEILAGGKTREICVKSATAYAQEGSAERIMAPDSGVVSHYLLFAGMSIILLSSLFYLYFLLIYRRQGDNRRQFLPTEPREQPPPYNSNLELRPLRTVVQEDEQYICENETMHEVNVQHKEETLVQAVPFRQPQYAEQNPTFEPNDDDSVLRSESEAEIEHEQSSHLQETNLELDDEETMHSEWTPFPRVEANNELVTADEPNTNNARCQTEGNPDSSRHHAIHLIINNNNTITINNTI